MNRHLDRHPTPEDMGLRLEQTTRLGLLDAVLAFTLVISAIAWVWVSLVGVEPDLLAALDSPAGRGVAALVGLATVAAVVRAFIVSRWPVTDDDGSLL
jgi:hypothetical protein